jgi:hypothetical protein
MIDVTQEGIKLIQPTPHILSNVEMTEKSRRSMGPKRASRESSPYPAILANVEMARKVT